MFGGGDFNNFIVINSLWHYDGAEWTWASGDDQVLRSKLYPNIGVPSTVDFPGARYGGSIWRVSENLFYIYGGYGYTENQNTDGLFCKALK
jgi:hypothetical protein